MSQHLINDFIHKNVVFKSFHGGKIVNKKTVKYQASNRENNSSPEDIEESVHELKSINHEKLITNKKVEKEQSDNNHDNGVEHIDVTV